MERRSVCTVRLAVRTKRKLGPCCVVVFRREGKPDKGQVALCAIYL